MLAGGLEVEVRTLDDRRGVACLRTSGEAASLEAAGLSVPYPSGLRRLRSELVDIELVVVERAPAGLRAAARREGVSWIDLNGAGRVELGSGRVIYDVPPGKEAALSRRVTVSPFAPAASRVIRVLLSDPERAWRLSDIAGIAEINPGNAHRILGELVERGLVERDEYAYVLIDPGRMLDMWAEQYEAPRERVVSGASRDLASCAMKLLAGGGKAVVSGEVAAELLVPYLPAESAIIHCLDVETFVALSREIKAMKSYMRYGTKVVIDLADRWHGAFQVERAGLPLAAPVQIYLDLARAPGRGREAAEQLRAEAIGF